MSKPQGLPREPSRAEEDALVERILRGDKKAMDELVLGLSLIHISEPTRPY